MPGFRYINLLWLLVTVGLPSASAAQANYRQKAQEQSAYIQSHFYDAKAKKYHDTFPIKPNGLPWTLMWANGVQWRVLVSAAQYNPARYKPVLDDFGQGLREYWDTQPKGSPPGFNAYCSGPGGDDKYYDDNAWLVLGYLEAYDAFPDPKYLQWARQTQDFVLSGWDDKLGGGIYWSVKHNSKNTCDNAPAAVGALRLAALGDAKQRTWALQILDWTNAHLKAEDGLYWDNIKLNGDIGKDKWTYNTALMIEADVLLFRQQGNRQALQQAERSADAGIAAWQDAQTGAFANDSNFTHLLCEALLQLYQTDHTVRYLNAVRRHAAFGYRTVRDAQNGGYWDHWKQMSHPPDERKSLLEQSSDARLFWLLAPYPDVDELSAKAARALDAGNAASAQNLWQQAADSDTEAVEARYHLWRLLVRRHETAAAQIQQQKLAEMSRSPLLQARLAALGWKEPAAPQSP